jgi:hypothetical protein
MYQLFIAKSFSQYGINSQFFDKKRSVAELEPEPQGAASF